MQRFGDQLPARMELHIVTKLTHCLDGKIAYPDMLFDPQLIRYFPRDSTSGAGKKFPRKLHGSTPELQERCEIADLVI